MASRVNVIMKGGGHERRTAIRQHPDRGQMRDGIECVITREQERIE
jgi:hypothetical protein